MKNEVFSGARFCSYFKYDIVQMGRNHIKAAIGIGLGGLIFYFLCIFFGLIAGEGWDGPNIATRFLIFILAFTALELYQTRTYGYITDHRKGGAYLMLPASTFEKWLSMLLITLVVIPVVFLVVFLGVDALLSLADPTVGESMVASIARGMTDVIDTLLEVKGEYDASWSLWTIAPLFLLSFCCNFLFFLLCGLLFRRHKLLGAFLVILGLSIFLSLISALIMVEADAALERYPGLLYWIVGLAAAGLAGCIFWRLKNLEQ